ncbi:universal stress protein [Streptomyces sp. NPDC053048]|uniref:universal stress protein n=1 Tax=Streptomyces sp. NPDC053048 TaxID=3365694 RepID=UPI0037D68C78
MVRPVVAGVDGSEESLNAAAWAAREAVARGTSLRIMHALEWRTSNLQFSPGVSAQREWAQNRIEEARQELAETRPGLEVEVEEVDELPAKALLDAARKAELLVLGSRGLSMFEGWLLGSVSLAVIAHAAVPVVLVRTGWEPPVAGGGGTVVVGIEPDGSYDPLLGFAFAAAAARQAVLRVVHVRRPEATIGSSSEEEPSGRLFAVLLAPWRRRWPNVEVEEWLTDGPAAQHVVEAAKDAQLLVVGRRVHRPAFGARIGPVTHAAVHHAGCPVAVVPHS